jgi:flavin-dependent dehydrogenase
MKDMHEMPGPRLHAAVDYDAVVIGGAFSGASAALLLRRLVPTARVLVVERQERFGRKVGEATVETSGMFLSRFLGLHDYLAREQLPKHGLRFWFSDGPHRRLEELSEIGPRKMPSLPSFQLDRGKMDEEVLRCAGAEGCEVARPAKVLAVELGWPQSRVRYEHAGATREVTTRWVLDGSGRQTFLARRLGLLEKVDSHPTAAAWARWRGMTDFDSAALQGGDPLGTRLPSMAAARRLATNHFTGYGWWCWVIPLEGGETSVGVVYDKRLFRWPTEGRVREQYRYFVTQEIAGLKELLAGATMDEDDFLAYAHLPYRSRQYMGKGWALVGDAGAFMDPLYSPGLDHAAMSIWATLQVLRHDLAPGMHGEEPMSEPALEHAIAVHNGEFGRSFDRWLDGLYHDKYEILGDAELVVASYLFDTGMYFLGIAGPIFRTPELLARPTFGEDIKPTAIAYRIMRFFKRRMVRLARFRRAVGTYGRRNVGWRVYPARFDVDRKRSIDLVVEGMKVWWGAERELLGWRLRHFGRRAPSAPPPRLDTLGAEAVGDAAVAAAAAGASAAEPTPLARPARPTPAEEPAARAAAMS